MPRTSPAVHLHGPGRANLVVRAAFVMLVAVAALAVSAAAIDANRTGAYAASSYKIVYKLKGGTQAKGQVLTIAKGATLKVAKLKKPLRAGYAFKGWYKDAKLKKKAKVLKGVGKKAQRRVYAKWKKATYKVSYVLNGGKQAKKKVTKYTYSSKKVSLPTPTRSGYSFLGWYTAASLTGSPLFAIPKKAHQSYRLYAKWRKRVYVNHRGAQTLAPENTLPAFYLSKSMGFDYVEADIRFTLDDEPVLLHDDTVNRTARDENGDALAVSTPISSLTFDEVRKLDFGSWKDPVYAGVQIPSFEEFIDTCKRLSLQPFIEVKTGTGAQVDKLAQIVSDAGMAGRVTWISFDFSILQHLCESFPKASYSYLARVVTSSTISLALSLANKGIDITLDVNKGNLTTARLNLCKNAGIPVGIYTLVSKSKAGKYDQYIYAFTSSS